VPHRQFFTSLVFSLAHKRAKSGSSIKKVSAKYFLTSLLLQFSIPPDLFPISKKIFMIEPRSSRLRPCPTSVSIQKNLPTGKNFSGSSLSVIQPEKLVFSIVTDTISVSDHTRLGSIPQSGGYYIWRKPVVGTSKRDPTAKEQQSPLVIEAGKILVVAIWFWCLIGANFCFDSLSMIVRYCMQDI
jgi:hypothetical protein